MPAQATILKNIVSFSGLVIGVPVSLPHKLNVNGVPVLPDIGGADAAGFTVTADTVNITVTRLASATSGAVDIYVEHWHTIEYVTPPGNLAGLIPFFFSNTGTGGGGGGPSVDVEDEGAPIANNPHTTINFIGAGVTAVDGGAGVANVTIPGDLGPQVNVEDEGAPIAGNPHTTLNFVGAGVTATDAGGGVATITIPGASAPVGDPNTQAYFGGAGALTDDLQATMTTTDWALKSDPGGVNAIHVDRVNANVEIGAGSSCAGGTNAIAAGDGVTAAADGAAAFGVGSTAANPGAFACGNGTLANAANAHAEGLSTIVFGANGHAEGQSTSARGLNAHAEGFNTDVQLAATNGHVEGNHAVVTTGDAGHAEGRDTVVGNDWGHAEGHATTASAPASHAEGDGSSSSGNAAHAEGNLCVANANFSHAEGNGSTADGVASHAQGELSIAFLEGQDTQACGSFTGGGGEAQTSNLVLRGSTPGVAINESTELHFGTGGAQQLILQDGKAYAFKFTVSVVGVQGEARVSRSFEGGFNARRDAGVTTITANAVGQSYGDNPQTNDWTFVASVGAAPDRIVLTFQSGAIITAAKVVAKVEFTEVAY